MDKNVNENGKSSHKKVWHKTGFIVKDKKPQNVPKQWTGAGGWRLGITHGIYIHALCVSMVPATGPPSPRSWHWPRLHPHTHCYESVAIHTSTARRHAHTHLIAPAAILTPTCYESAVIHTRY